jgi:hypothetical protein
MFSKSVISASGILIACLLGLVGCRTTHNSNKGLSTLGPKPLDPLFIPLDTSDASYDGLKRKLSVSTIYQDRNGTPIWLDEQGTLTSPGDSLLLFIHKSSYYGLTLDDYYARKFDTPLTKRSKEALLKMETQLTDAFVTLSSDLKYGRGSNVNDTTGVSLLKQIHSADELRKGLESLEPTFSGYKTLKHSLRFVLDSLPYVMDVDSIRMLDRVRVINLNLDRWRHETLPFPSRYVYVNIPSFMLQVIENDSVIFSSKVIVGATKSPSPQLSSIIECFTIYPYWNVPRKIAVEEYLSRIQKDTAFIARNNFDVLDRNGKILNPDSVDWTKFNKDYFPVILRQREGEENSLGIIKFMFDNPYAVYLHDTNARRLFRKSKRAFSHGCIRVEKAIELAHYLQTSDVKRKSIVVEKYLQEKQRHTVNLRNPIPIYIRYFTAEVSQGKFAQYEDIYEKDLILNLPILGMEAHK